MPEAERIRAAGVPEALKARGSHSLGTLPNKLPYRMILWAEKQPM